MRGKYTHTDVVKITDENNELLKEKRYPEHLYVEFGYEMISIMSYNKSTSQDSVILKNISVDECVTWLVGFNFGLITILDL